MTGCTIVIRVVLDALRLKGLQRCHVYVGPVRGSVYVDRCSGCTFAVPCRQLRIHDTTGTDFYVRTASGPIIEGCHAVRFAEYCLSYANLDEQMEEAQLAAMPNAWSDVKDFKWHRAQRSPNWGPIPQEDHLRTADRVPEDVLQVVRVSY
jgi:hypothetical protein